jgi:cytochrome c oxidase cbb3-type subunit 3
VKARARSTASFIAAAVVLAGALGRSQTPLAAPPAQTPPATGRGRAAPPVETSVYADSYPQRPPADPAALARGKTLYSVNCAFCHGIDARGGDGGGPNLLRSQLVMGDQHGEAIAEVVQNGRPGTPMLAMKLTTAQIADIATYVHSFRVGGYDITRQPAASIVVGEVKAGEAAFRSRCAACHSATGDLRGIAAKFQEPRDLQQAWLMPPAPGRAGRGGPALNVPPTTATITLASGQKVEGRLVRIDDFVVTLELANGMTRSFSRSGDSPKVEIKDPLKPHRDLLSQYTDDEIHNITAYLVSLK